VTVHGLRRRGQTRTVKANTLTADIPAIVDSSHRKAITRMQLFFDYTCPFAYNAHRWLEEAGVATSADWRIFSLLEHNYRGDGPPVWELEERQNDISLLIFAGQKLVARESGDLDTYRRTMFETWHQTRGQLNLEHILRIVKQASVDGSEDDLRDVFLDAASDHNQARRLGIFGSPSIVFDEDRVVFVKLDKAPTGESARSLLHHIENLAGHTEILEIKRPHRPRSDAQSPTIAASTT